MPNLLFAIPFGIVTLVGILIVIFAEQIKTFVNKLDPLKMRYSKKYFIILGIILIIVSLSMMFVVMLQ
jgi:hypothetical protein